MYVVAKKCDNTNRLLDVFSVYSKYIKKMRSLEFCSYPVFFVSLKVARLHI